MNNYLINAFLIIALLLTVPARCLAEGIPARECPSVPAIIAAGLTDADHDYKYPTTWTVVNFGDHFGTEHTWSLEIEFITAQTEAEAIAKGNAALHTLIFSGVDMFFCLYRGEYDGSEITGRAMKIKTHHYKL